MLQVEELSWFTYFQQPVPLSTPAFIALTADMTYRQPFAHFVVLVDTIECNIIPRRLSSLYSCLIPVEILTKFVNLPVFLPCHAVRGHSRQVSYERYVQLP